MQLQNIKHIHFIGVGGSGLSALARICQKLGFVVSGSDIEESKTTKELQNEGITVYIGHHEKNIGKSIDLVIVTSAVIEENPEVEEAKRKGIPVFKRDFLIGKLMEGKIGIGISGTHGKTTTTAMVTYLLKSNKLDPTFLIGGVSKNYQTNAGVGTKDYFVIEADEYDNAFLGLKPQIAVVTSIEMDHPDCFANLQEYTTAFKKFLSLVPEDGLVVACGDWPEIQKILPQLNAEVITYGKNKKNDWYFQKVKLSPGRSSFNVCKNGKEVGSFGLSIPGEHNVTNALVPIIIGDYLGIPLQGIKSALQTFKGTKMRFDILGEVNDILVVEDYAHHPTAVRVTLQAGLTYNRPVKVVYQPHQYARTAVLLNDYEGVFAGAKKVYLNKIFAARDKDTTCVSGEDLLKVIKKDGTDAEYIESIDGLFEKAASEADPGDLILVMAVGNGHIIAEKIVLGLKTKSLAE